MGSKKPTEDAALPLENTALDTASQADTAEADASLSGPDAPAAEVVAGVDDEVAPAADPVETAAEAEAGDQADTSAEVGPEVDEAALPLLTALTTAEMVEMADVLLEALPDDAREVLLAKWAVPPEVDAMLDAFAEPAPVAVDLERLLNEIGARTSGGIVTADCRAFLAAEGAEIAEEPVASVSLGGVTASSAFGLHRALLDWCMAATRAIMARAA